MERAKAVLRKEFLDKRRNRWIQMSALALLIFMISVSYFSGSPAGVVGFKRFEAIFVSLLTLVTYLIPLIALLLGAGAFSEERERGTLDILLASGMGPWDLWTGKFLGYSLTVAGSVLGGYLPALLLLLLKFGPEVGPYLFVFTLSSLLLGVSMVGISLSVSVLLMDRVKALSVAVLLWLLLVILYDLSLLGLLVLTKGAISKPLFTALLLLNPVDLFRLVNLVHVGELKAMLGFATLDLPPYLRPPLPWIPFVAWSVVPFLVGYQIFKRRLKV